MSDVGRCELCGETVPCPMCSGINDRPVYLSETDMVMISELLCQKARELGESANFTKNQFAKELSDQMHALCGKLSRARKEVQESGNEQNRVPQRSLG